MPFLNQSLLKLGFDKGLFRYALRTTFAAATALFAAWVLGLEHPQWAAMSVWTVSHPAHSKGSLAEKSFYRILGTFVGATIGVLMVQIAHGNSLALALALTLWLTVCAGGANLLKGSASYLILLSGYTASLVVLLDSTQTSGILLLGIDRFLTVLVGVLLATIIGYWGSKTLQEGVLSVRVKQLTQSTLTVLSFKLAEQDVTERVRALLSEAADIESTFASYGAGAIRSKRSVHTLRAILLANVSLLTRFYIGELRLSKSSKSRTSVALERLIGTQLSIGDEIAAIGRICTELEDPELIASFQALQQALTQRLNYYTKSRKLESSFQFNVFLHRDWTSAYQAMCRTGFVLAAVSLIWSQTQSSWSTFLFLGTSIIVTLFSTFDAPSKVTRKMLLWQVLGFVASLTTLQYLTAYSNGALQNIMVISLMMAWVIVPLSFARSHAGSMDYAMMFLMLTNVHFPTQFELSTNLPIGMAAIGGTVIATLAFALIFPFDRIRQCLRMRYVLKKDFLRITHAECNTSKAKLIHTKSLYRLLKIVRNRTQIGSYDAVEEAILLTRSIQVAFGARFINHPQHNEKTSNPESFILLLSNTIASNHPIDFKIREQLERC